MGTEPSARRNPVPVIAIVCGLLFMIGAVQASLAGTTIWHGQRHADETPANAASPTPRERPSIPGGGPLEPPVMPPSAGSPGPTTENPPAGTPTPPGTGPGEIASGRAGPDTTNPSTEIRALRYQRSLVYSGLFGLAISITGLTMVGLKRRRW